MYITTAPGHSKLLWNVDLMEGMASPSLLERNHPAVTLDPDSLKLRISLSSAYRKKEEFPGVQEVEEEEEEDDEEEDEEESEESSGGEKSNIPWEESLYESLRLCRKRAYCKVQSKRRLHLPASLAVFLHREWNSLYPQYKIKPRDLLDIYENRFEGGSKRRKPYVKKPKKNTPAKKSSTVQWTPSTLMHLSLIGQKVEKLLAENPQLDYSSKLQEEWLKYYPDSALTGRNLKARLFLYNKTRPDYASHTKKSDVWNKDTTDLLVKIYNQLSLDEKSSSKLAESLSHHWSKDYRGTLVVTSSDLVLKIEELLEKEPGLFLNQSSNNCNIKVHESETVPSEESSDSQTEVPLPSWSYRVPLPPRNEWVCHKHWVHIFDEASPALHCSLTEDLVNIRNSYKDLYPNCDIFEKPYLKQPRKAGLIGAIMNEWGRRHPDFEDSVRSIVLKLYKYDRIPDITYFTALDNRAKLKYYMNGDSKTNEEVLPSRDSEEFEWTDEMLEHLKETREYAEMKAEENANGTPSVQAVTRIWKNRWKSMYPDLTLDWKSAVEKYNSLGSFSSTILNDEITNTLKAPRLMKSDTDMASSEDSEVKGFRQWNVNMKQGLINTKDNIIKSLHPQTIDLESKQFATLLFNEFRKLFPKCMESTRSLLSKLQSIEKEGFVPAHLKYEDTKPSEFLGNGHTPLETSGNNESNNKYSTDMEILPKVEECYGFKDEIMPPITGFPNWSLSMIRDFIACMDAARRKYSALKNESSSNKQSQPRLIPLLLNEWKEIYPESTETDKTFLEKIKHLKVQKETIKTYLGQSGLLPKRETLPASLSPPEVQEKAQVSEESEDKISWNKSMIEDVVRTRDIALKRLGETQTKGKKVSFHDTWWEEFKKIYPNCSFGKNSLSAHYWKWKKTQNVMDKKTHQKPDQNYRPDNKYHYQSKRSYTNWTKEDKDQLLDLAFKLQKNSSHEALRSKGFGAVLRDEWKQLRPDRVDHPSTLNLLYAKYLKEIKANSAVNSDNVIEKDGKLKVSKWTPRHNQVLRKCLMDCPKTNNEEGFSPCIIDSWRKSFPNSTLSNEEIEDRLNDLLVKSTTSSASWNLTPDAKKHLNVIFVRIFCQTLKRRRMRKDLIILPEKKLELANNLHKAFVRKFPDCPLSPMSLLNESDMFRSKYSNVSDEDTEVSKTWTPLMITNMIETRKAALLEKKSSDSPESFNFGDVWYQKFIKLHPEFLSTKRNLIRKYKWHKSQLDHNGLIHSDSSFSCAEDERVPTATFTSKNIRKDFLQHINTLLESPQISLPPRLPPKEELFKSKSGPSQLISTDTNEQFTSSGEEGKCFHFPGGAKLIPIGQGPIEKKDESVNNEVTTDCVSLSIMDIPSVVESRLHELGLSSKDFCDLLNVYANARDEYSTYLKKGYLIFFPFTLQVAWCRCKKDSRVAGRDLVGLVQMFLENFYANLGEFCPTELIEKVPSKLNVSELILKQVLDCFADAAASSQAEYSRDVDAYDLWKTRFPKTCFTFKELVSLHRMLLFEETQEADLLENLILDCAIADISSQFTLSEVLESHKHSQVIQESNVDYDEDNLSIEQLTEWYYKTKNIPSSMGMYSPCSIGPHFGVKNMKLFWSYDRMRDLELCYQKAKLKFKKQVSNPRFKYKTTILTLMDREWNKMYPENKIDGKILVGKYVSYIRRRKSERSYRENLRIHELNMDVLDFLDSEHTTTLEPESCPEEFEERAEVDELVDEQPESKEVTVEEVLQKIDEKGKRSAVWTSSVMRDLLKARDESKRKKKEIERDPKAQKVDNLFVEEWKKIRPKMGYMSIWTLNAYVRKFDQFRNKLLLSKQVGKRASPEVEKRRFLPIKYYPGSCIPIYDLEALQQLKVVSQEVKDLLVTRQRAMEMKVIKGSKYTLDYLWPLEWKKISGVEMSANQLRNKLWSVERFPSNMERLRVALLRSLPSEKTINYNQEMTSSYMPILPRRYLFPEEQILRTPFKFIKEVSFLEPPSVDNSEDGHHKRKRINTFLSLSSESLSSREASLDIPKVKFEKQILAAQNDDSDDVSSVIDNELYWDKFLPKRIKLEASVAKPLTSNFSCDSSGYFACNECGKKFRNINNYDFHAQMH